LSEFDIVITGGTVADAGGSGIADLGIKDGRIAAIGRSGTLTASRHIDAAGMVVVPGGVDPHVHSATSLGEFDTLDTFEMSTTAAAWGGTTTIVDFAIPQPAGAVSPSECAEQRMELARDAVVDVAFHACITRGDERSIQDIKALSQRGLTTVKVFTIYKDLVMLSLDEIYACMRATAAVNGMLLVHAESPHLIDPLRESFVRQGQTSADKHAISRPLDSELDMVRTVIDMLRATGCRGYIVHVSTPEAAIAIADARMQGVQVWAETCPHYVLLDDHLYSEDKGELYICSPPIRPLNIARRLWDLVCAGFIDVWGSDHCCYDSTQKLKYRGDFSRVPNGLPGIEVRAPLLFSEGVVKGRMSLERFVALTSTNPARMNGLFPKKGSFAIGADADVAIYDPKRQLHLHSDDLHMATDYTPFEGYAVTGWPRTVLAKGRVLVDEMEFLGEAGWGQILAASQPIAPL
jgi:dihydropyrimidinase